MIVLKLNMVLLGLLFLAGSFPSFAQRTTPGHWYLGGGFILSPSLGGVLSAGVSTRGGYLDGTLSCEVRSRRLSSRYRMQEEYLGLGVGYCRRVLASRSRGVVLSLGGGALGGVYIPDPFSRLPENIKVEREMGMYLGAYGTSCLEVYISKDVGVSLEGRLSLKSTGTLLPSRITLSVHKTI